MFQFGKALRKIHTAYDAVHMLFLHVGYSPWVKRIRKTSPRIVVSVFGSDFYQSPPIIRTLLKRIVKQTDLFTAANPKTLSDFAQYYGLTSEYLRLCRFGLSPLDTIKALNPLTRAQAKEQLGFPSESLLIVCGYNASPLQQHEELIDSLRSKTDQFFENTLFVFPIASNADAARKAKIRQLLETSGLYFKTIDTYLSDGDLAKLRLAADVMIQVQKTDQLSGSMQEHLFAGSVVITGSWLPYAVFDEEGIFLERVHDVSACGSCLSHLLKNLDEYRQKSVANAYKIWRLSSWESNIADWLKLYEK